MVRNYKRKTSRAENYTQEELRTAVEAVKSGRQTIVQAATQFKIPKPTLVDHVKNRRGAKSTTQGRPTALSPEDEKRLASLIKIIIKKIKKQKKRRKKEKKEPKKNSRLPKRKLRNQREYTKPKERRAQRRKANIQCRHLKPKIQMKNPICGVNLKKMKQI